MAGSGASVRAVVHVSCSMLWLKLDFPFLASRFDMTHHDIVLGMLRQLHRWWFQIDLTN